MFGYGLDGMLGLSVLTGRVAGMTDIRRAPGSDVVAAVRAGVLGDDREPPDLDGTRTADALARAQEAVVAAELAQVELVAHWADLHASAGCDASTVLAGLERDVRLGADGTPLVREFAATELGVLIGTTTHAARSLMRDVLDLRHRHPMLWSAVLDRRARFWQARQVARVAHAAGLDREGTRHVDARTAPHLGSVPWGRMLSLVEAAVIEADPEEAERRRLEKAHERYVRTSRSAEHGLRTVYAQVDAGDADVFVATCDRIARLLRAQGDEQSMDVLRARAVGWLGTPLRAAALLAGGDHPSAAAAPGSLVIEPGVDLDRFLPGSTLYVHMSLEQVLGQVRGAARVEGLGPVTVENAVDLLRHRRVRLTPVIDLHETWSVDGYQTPPRLREHVDLRSPVEVFPHGTLVARRADGDHVVPYRVGRPPGRTSTDNIAPLARGHHRVKTHGRGWVHRQPVPGVHYWRTPHGHWARVDHRGTHTLGRDLGIVDRTLLDEGASRCEQAFAALVLAA